MVTYSYSKLQTFEQCALKYKFRYIDKIQVEFEQTIEAFLGHCVHVVLEFLYQEKMQGRDVNIQALIEKYIETWSSEYKEGILIVKNLKVEDYLNKGVKFLTSYFSRNYPFDEKTLATERKITMDLDSKSKLIGFVDRLAYNPKEDVYEIHDYKTGSLKTSKQLELDRQLALYSLALREEFNDGKDILLIWHYLDHDERIVLKKNHDELQKLKKQVLELISEIESTRVFTYNKGPLCNWCEFKSMCPAWTKQKSLFDFK